MTTQEIKPHPSKEHVAKQKKHKIIICIPQEKFMHIEAVQDLLALQLDLVSRNWDVVMLFDTGYNLAFIRNKLLEKALKECAHSEASFILWLDSDMKVSANSLYRLMLSYIKNGHDILSAKYHIRGKKDLLCAFNIKENGEWDNAIVDEGQTGIISVDGVGFGCLIATPSKFLEIVDLTDVPFKSSDTSPIGEDLAFCRQLKDLDFKIGMDCDVSVGHYSVVPL